MGAQKQTYVDREKRAGWVVQKVVVEFGQLLANGDCGHVGICRMTAWNERATVPARRRCRRAKAFLCCGPDGVLELFFPRKGMLPCMERGYFHLPFFRLPHPFEFPPDLLAILPTIHQPILKAGNYAIHSDPKGFSVLFG